MKTTQSGLWTVVLIAGVLAACGDEAGGDEAGDTRDASPDTLDSDTHTDGSSGDARDSAADARDATADARDSAGDARDATSDSPDADVDVIGYPECIDTPCPEGYECFTEGCLPVIAPGEPCGGDLGFMCQRGSTCATIDEAQVCAVDGTDGAFCRYSGGGECVFEDTLCDAGLGCDTSSWSRGICRDALSPGELCGAPGDLCASDAACVLVQGTLRCVPRGQAGSMCVGASGASPLFGGCDDGLVCAQFNTECVRASDVCQRGVESGGDCAERADRCRGSQVCASTPTGRQCVDPGGPGAQCDVTAPNCDEGLECAWSDTGGATCVDTAEIGGVCDPLRREHRCGEGASCTSDNVSDPGVCAAPGTVAGADCRLEGDACDGDLTCTDFSRYRRTCRATVGEGGACDLGAIATSCASGLRCAPVERLPSGHLGAVCIDGADEIEPNERSVERAAIGATSVVRGVLSADDAEDCATVELEGGDSLFVELSADNFHYAVPPVVRLWRGDVEQGRWSLFDNGVHGPLTHVVRLEPRLVPLLADMEAGSYTLCVSRDGEPLGAYELAIGVIPAS